ncbi:hypothetical protein E2562_022593 [Oryza meyeriana var. granulata]|uniref:Uncharacterized protein n=1 Tax=Oryza meyeriana var. granulata TaxID=110450 RepID=A0A6G1CS56_9ORYZ|nr:hypothetical protein E2562_022593 [Oryza meyeriana var. granulata]
MVPAAGEHRFLAELAGRAAPTWTVTASDVEWQQNRLSIPSGMRCHLLPLLSPDERAAANLVEEGRRSPKQQSSPSGTAVEEAADLGQKPGLRVSERGCPARRRGALVGAEAGADGTVIRGEGFSAFFRCCGFRLNDAVEIWAFRQSPCVRLFGVDLQPTNGPMHIVIAKTGDQQWQPPAALPQPAPVTVT